VTAHSGRGQGDEPLYEGVVLPANGDPWTPEQQRQVAQSHTQPPAGQPWGQPWGPESQAAVTSTENSTALPPPPPHAPPAPPVQPPPVQPPAPPPVQPPAVGEYGGAGPMPQPGAPLNGQPSPGALPSGPDGGPVPAAPMPAPGQAPGHAPVQAPAPHNGQALYGDAQLPQAQPQAPWQSYAGDARATQMLPPQQGLPAQAFNGAQQPQPGPLSASDATQFIQPVTGAPPPGHMPPAADADATQMLPPQTGHTQDPEATTTFRSPLPPETRAGTAGSYGPGGGGAAQQQQQHQHQHQHLQQQQRQTPAEFDNLFRAEPGAAGSSGEPGSTQSLPLFDQAVARQRSGGVGGLGASAGRPVQGGHAGGQGGPGAPGGPYGPNGAHAQGPGHYEPQGRAARRNAERGTSSRLTSPLVLIAAGVVIVAGVGMAAGAALSGGGDDKDNKSESSAPRAEEKKAPAGPAPAEVQAKKLDQLLGDSNNSRTTVIRSVENIKSCKKLGEAATDLRAAAGQRNGLVARLGKLETDELPSGAKLTASLTRAWKSSASADNHYATWADQTAGKKGCRKGKARVTAHTGAGTRASGEATTAKKQAAAMWNPTAKKYGLKERQFGQL